MPTKLSALLVQDRVVSFRQMDAAVQRQQAKGGRIGTNLLELGHVDEGILLYYVSKQRHMPSLDDAALLEVDPKALALLTAEQAHAWMTVPLEVTDDTLRVAVMDPLPDDAIAALAEQSGRTIEQLLALEVRIWQALGTLYEIEIPQRFRALIDRFPVPIRTRDGRIDTTGAYAVPDDAMLEEARAEREDSPSPSLQPAAPAETGAEEPVATAEETTEGITESPPEATGTEVVAPTYIADDHTPPGLTWSIEELSAFFDASNSRDHMLLAALGFAGKFFVRRSLFIVGKSGLRGFAIQMPGAPDTPIEHVEMALDRDGSAGRLVGGGAYYFGPVSDSGIEPLLEQIGGDTPKAVLAVPVKVGPRAALLLIADCGEDTVPPQSLPVTFLAVNRLSSGLERLVRLLKTRKAGDTPVDPPAVATADERTRNDSAVSQDAAAFARAQRDELIDQLAESGISLPAAGLHELPDEGWDLSGFTRPVDVDGWEPIPTAEHESAPMAAPVPPADLLAAEDRRRTEQATRPEGEEAVIARAATSERDAVDATPDDPLAQTSEADVSRSTQTVGAIEAQPAPTDGGATQTHDAVEVRSSTRAQEALKATTSAHGAVPPRTQDLPPAVSESTNADDTVVREPKDPTLAALAAIDVTEDAPEAVPRGGAATLILDTGKESDTGDGSEPPVAARPAPTMGTTRPFAPAPEWPHANEKTMSISPLPLPGEKDVDDEVPEHSAASVADVESPTADETVSAAVTPAAPVRSKEIAEAAAKEAVAVRTSRPAARSDDATTSGVRSEPALHSMSGAFRAVPSSSSEPLQSRRRYGYEANITDAPAAVRFERRAEETGPQPAIGEGVPLADRRPVDLDVGLPGVLQLDGTDAEESDESRQLREELIAASDDDLIAWLTSDEDVRSRSAFVALLDRGQRAHASLMRHFPGPLLVNRRTSDAVLNPQPLEKHGPVVWLVALQLRSIFPRLYDAARSDDPDARYYACRLLQQAGDPDALAEITNRLFDTDAQVRETSLQFLEAHLPGSPAEAETTKAIRRRLSATESWVVDQAIAALSRLRDTQAVGDLVVILDHPSDRTRQKAAQALTRLTYQDFGVSRKQWERWFRRNGLASRGEWLLAAMVDKEWKVRDNAARALRAMPRLIVNYHADSDRHAREVARRAVHRHLYGRDGGLV